MRNCVSSVCLDGETVDDGDVLTWVIAGLTKEAALCFFKALRVYPQPKELMTIYDKTVPKVCILLAFRIPTLMQTDCPRHPSRNGSILEGDTRRWQLRKLERWCGVTGDYPNISLRLIANILTSILCIWRGALGRGNVQNGYLESQHVRSVS